MNGRKALIIKYQHGIQFPVLLNKQQIIKNGTAR